MTTLRQHSTAGYLSPAKNRKARQRAIANNADQYGDMFALMVANIRAVFEQAEDEHEAYAEGIDWYRVAHTFAHQFALDYGVTFEIAAGVIAVLSPSTSWARNVQLAGDMLETGDCSHAYGNAIEQARRIIAGEPLDQVVKVGRKVRNFYRCILNPETAGHVCVDRHAVVLATGQPIATLDGWLDLVGTYQLTAAAYRTVARQVGLLPCQVQAITWVQHRKNTGADQGNDLVF